MNTKHTAVKKQHWFSYITYFYRLNKLNTTAVILLKILNALVYCIEIIVVADILNDMIQVLTDNGRISIWNILFVVAAWAAGRICDYCYEIFKNKLVICGGRAIPESILCKKQCLSFLQLENIEIQELMNRIGTDPTEKFVENFDNMLSLLEVMLQIAGLVCIIAVKNVWIAVLVVAVMVPYYMVSIRNGKHDYEAYEAANEHFRRADYFKKVLSDRSYMEERTLFQYGRHINEKWTGENREAIRIECGANKRIYARIGLVNGITTLTIGILAATLMMMIHAGSMTIGLYMSLMRSFIHYVETISGSFTMNMMSLEKGRLFYGDYRKLLSLEETQESEEDGLPGRRVQPGNIRKIEFQNVCFTYPGAKQPVLRNLSFTLEDNRTYAFVGENGAGKSTVVKLMLGFYNDYTGQILINDTDIRQLDQESLRSSISSVPQEMTRYEIALKEYLQGSDECETEKVLQRLGIQEILGQKGLDTRFGRLEKDSVELSGGQWQLLAIARSILADRSMYILDEPTASIDPVKEAEIYGVFRSLIQEKLALLITHRMGAARLADEILVLQDGCIAEKGNHDQLVKTGSIYAELFEMQKGWYHE